jgi:hypothetical protein
MLPVCLKAFIGSTLYIKGAYFVTIIFLINHFLGVVYYLI